VNNGAVVWDASNRKHLTEDHPERDITVDEVADVLTDPDRLETEDERRGSFVVVGTTRTGRWLYVAYVLRKGGTRYPIHARPHARRKSR
jgi:uncharacterized DUF497 family protein